MGADTDTIVQADRALQEAYERLATALSWAELAPDAVALDLLVVESAARREAARLAHLRACDLRGIPREIAGLQWRSVHGMFSGTRALSNDEQARLDEWHDEQVAKHRKQQEDLKRQWDEARNLFAKGNAE